MANRVRIKDLAEYLGVNASTVSRALNPATSSMISEEVVSRVKTAARELNYVTDFAAASLRNQRSYTVGVVIPDILNPVFPPIIKGIQEYLTRAGYVIFTVYSNNDQAEATREIQRLAARRVDGIIIASAFLEDSSIEYCLSQDIPFVAVNRSIRRGHLIHQVLDDDAYGISMAVAHLKELGHRRIVHFAGPQNILHGVGRYRAFVESCKAHDLDYDIIQADSFSVAAGITAAREFLSRPGRATAIVAGNDLIAVGAIKHFRENGINVPEDFSIVGFNGMPFSEMLSPALTTVAIPHEDLGQQAARLLLNAIDDVDGPKQKILLTPRLEIRESTARVSVIPE